jgi:hypothetical protein
MPTIEQTIKQMERNRMLGVQAGKDAIDSLKAAHGMDGAQKRAQLRLLQRMKQDEHFRQRSISEIVGLFNKGLNKKTIAKVLGVSYPTLEKVWKFYSLDSKVLDRKLISAGVVSEVGPDEIKTFEGALEHLARLALYAEKDSDKTAATRQLVELAALARRQNDEGLPVTRLEIMEGGHKLQVPDLAPKPQPQPVPLPKPPDPVGQPVPADPAAPQATTSLSVTLSFDRIAGSEEYKM